MFLNIEVTRSNINIQSSLQGTCLTLVDSYQSVSYFIGGYYVFSEVFKKELKITGKIARTQLFDNAYAVEFPF